MAVGLKQCAIRTIALQSTGVYGIAVYDILEEAGFAKAIIYRKRFGVLVRFAFSGNSNAGSALCAIQRSPASRDGVFIIASPV
jgi:hypothetical protein